MKEDITIGPVRLSDQLKEVFLNGRIVSVTRMEFKVLQFFMENPNIVWSRDILIEKVWGWRSDTDTRAVDNLLSCLGRKIGKIIQNKRGFGYILLKQ